MDSNDAGNGAGGENEPSRRKIPKMNTASRTMAFWLVIVLLVIASTRLMQGAGPPRINLAYSEFKGEVRSDNVAEVTIIEQEIRGRFRKAIVPPGAPETLLSDRFETYAPPGDDRLMEDLQDHGVLVRAQEQRVRWTTALITWLPIVLILFFWIYLMRQMQMGGNKAFSFGKSKARLLTDNRPKVTFNDVAGIDEAKAELQEIVEFLREPAKFQKLGGKIPKGVLLLGSPGTGKTLLARAIAGEADAPFFSMSGSDFVEMFVGVGASRVRDLFEQGKKQAPCIIFIDEIDAVGRHRGAGLGGGHDEREQTLNQLLVEMDGFETNEGVILVAATNRPDVLDPALLRPGRFDRQVVVDRPDVKGREGILKIHSGKIPLAADVELSRVARGTPGFSGADLANLVNEAALLAARDNQETVSMAYLEEARDKVMMGSERKSLILDEDERRKTAHHEAGHALVRWLIPGTDPLHKVTIIPRGRALGITWHLPVRDRYSITRSECEDEIACMLGGRVAEEVIFGEFTSGAGDDLKKVTERARKMVCEWGMSDRVGPLTFGEQQEEVFLGRDISQNRDYSEQTAVAIDEEIRRIVDEQEIRVKNQLTENRDMLVLLAEALLERESLDGAEVDVLLTGGTLEPLSTEEDVGDDETDNAESDASGEEESPLAENTEVVDSPSAVTSSHSGEDDSIQGELPLVDAVHDDAVLDDAVLDDAVLDDAVLDDDVMPTSRDSDTGNGHVELRATSDDGGSEQGA